MNDGRARLEELLCDRAVFGLNASESAELARLLQTLGESDDFLYDLAAADVALSVTPAEPLPSGVRARVLDDARRFDFAARRVDVAQHDVAPELPGFARPTSSWPSSSWPSTVAWLAVAASLLVGAWLGRTAGDGLATDERTVATRRAELARTTDAIGLAWSATDDKAARAPDGADRAAFAWGDVVWSDERQEGYMTFRGLAVNDPDAEQYQLWVFDAERDDRYPVDGGVFDVAYGPGSDEAVVPIRTRLRVNKAVMFAVTVERPGGVVVSDRSRLPLLAKR
ncbi:MAG: anti-sigma factor domain-containing protein [Lacipirellulaceae bacterium]